MSFIVHAAVSMLTSIFFGKEAAKENSYQFLEEQNTASTVMFYSFRELSLKYFCGYFKCDRVS